MVSVVAKDRQNRHWFKSDQKITDITRAVDFYVYKSGIWKKKYHVYARFVKKYENFWGDKWNEDTHKKLGTYDSKEEASVALGEILEVRGMKVVS